MQTLGNTDKLVVIVNLIEIYKNHVSVSLNLFYCLC